MKKKEFVIDYTEADIAAMRAQGIDEDAIPSVGRHVFKRVAPSKLASRTDSKARINIYIDLDVLDHFRKRAEKQNAAPYQTQINSELRAIMERDLAHERVEIEETAERLLNDDRFLDSISKRLKQKELVNS
ncbi:MAG TPA: BrnA antitoxin family protein [Pyrinomonadaceae bacterium]|nr:BrnA antitoxin family protein [Pyrinomonadaceae bacterium]